MYGRYSSSPSTRFTGADVTGQREEELPIPETWLAMYAETKAKGEQAVSAAHGTRIVNDKDKDDVYILQTISVAPHQVYGPHDALMLPNLLETAGHGLLRIFGTGLNKISVCFADNYAHGLMCGADALQDETNANTSVGGKFYIITDGEPVYFWKFINQAVLAMGFADIEDKYHLPTWLLYSLAYLCNVVGWLLGGKKFKLNPFNVRMLTIHRYFSIENAQRDLHYQPVVGHDEAWALTIRWFQDNWLPGFLEQNPNIKVTKKTTSAGAEAASKKKD
jgi:nucleoside-diphosphate-sugar epimerase